MHVVIEQDHLANERVNVLVRNRSAAPEKVSSDGLGSGPSNGTCEKEERRLALSFYRRAYG